MTGSTELKRRCQMFSRPAIFPPPILSMTRCAPERASATSRSPAPNGTYATKSAMKRGLDNTF
jgi:hypothetical protein